ncbi:MAG: DMT family transporter, partial [Pseudomonadota bacterium]
PLAVLAMIGSGISWGIYSLLGRRSLNPTAQTGANFIRASGIAFILFAVWIGASPLFDTALFVTPEGLLWACVSGAITSGLGYAIWYAVLPSLSANRAGLLQLSVPPLAAMGGILFLGEALSVRFTVASAIILGGIALAMLQKKKAARQTA